MQISFFQSFLLKVPLLKSPKFLIFISISAEKGQPLPVTKYWVAGLQDAQFQISFTHVLFAENIYLG